MIEHIIDNVRSRLDMLEEARDRALKISRDIIRLSGKTISYLTSNKREEAERFYKEMLSIKNEYDKILEDNPQLRYTGFTNNTLSEYAEAVIYYKIVNKRRIPSPSEINVDDVPYILGLADTIGELRRYVMEKIRKKDFKEAWEIFALMEEIYVNLKDLDYPEAMVPGLRHKVDVARRLVEDTKTLLLDIESREHVIESTNVLLEKISGFSNKLRDNKE